MPRLPFEYPDWCTGPVVDTDIIPPGFPLCSVVDDFTLPTFMPQGGAITIPYIIPPPLCVCIPTGYATGTIVIEGDCGTGTYFDAGTYIVHPDGGTYYYGAGTHSVPNGEEGCGGPFISMAIKPITGDCCNPEFELDYDIVLPCMPFDIETEIRVTDLPGLHPSGVLRAHRHGAECEYLIELDLNIPPVGGIRLDYGDCYIGTKINYVMECDPFCDFILSNFLEPILEEDFEDPDKIRIGLIGDLEFDVPLLARLSNTEDDDIVVDMPFFGFWNEEEQIYEWEIDDDNKDCTPRPPPGP